jgi:hypothetical protein
MGFTLTGSVSPKPFTHTTLVQASVGHVYGSQHALHVNINA